MTNQEREKMITEVYDERYRLMMDKMTEITLDPQLSAPYGEYFCTVAVFVRQVMETYEKCSQRLLINSSLEELKGLHDRLYDRVSMEAYGQGYLDPVYAQKTLGKELGGYLSAVYADLLSLIPAAYELRMDLICLWSELVVELYCLFAEAEREHTLSNTTPEREFCQEIHRTLCSFYHDDLDIFLPDHLLGMISTEEDFLYNMIMFSDLSDDRYLYQYGSCIGDNEIGLATYLRTLSQEQIDAMARTYTEGFCKGFEVLGKDLSKKKTVRIDAPIGMERVVRAAIGQFKERGLHVVLQRERVTSFAGRGGRPTGIYSSSVNRQFLFDHREDKAIYLSKAFVERRLEVVRDVFEKNKETAAVFGGPAVIEVFGEELFAPEMKDEAIRLDPKQNKLNLQCVNEEGQIRNHFIPGAETSFTIIAFPLPAIGKDFEAIFQATVEINTLDYHKYQQIQQKIIDTLDEGYAVRITGRGENRTDLTVMLHALEDPKKQTNFENCVADVNIPLGEVFTSPVLEGTNGILHVSCIYL